MQIWVLTYAPPVAIVVVWARDLEEARRLATAELAEKASGITPKETAAVPMDQPPDGGVVFSSIITVT
jgi:hypothetical protein